MATKWDYYGIFPNGAEQSSPFWGVHGIISTSGSFSPSGVLTADTTTPTTPDTVTIVCSAIFTKLYEWQRKVNGTWTPLLGQTKKQIDLDYVLGDGGVYEYRCKLTGWAGEAFTAPVTITVSEPKPIIIITTDARILNIGQTATLTASVMPRPEYAKSIEWQQSTDGTTWTVCGTGETFTYSPASAGQIHFRAIAIGYGESTTSNVITITTRNPPTVTIAASETEITTIESSIITATAKHYNSIKWQIRRGELWEVIPGEVSTVYTFAREVPGVYSIRAKVTGDGGEAASEPVTIKVIMPEPEIEISADAEEIFTGEIAELTATVTPYPECALSIDWQQSSDGEEWEDVGEGDGYSFAPETAGTYYFRAIANGYTESRQSNVVIITVTEPEPEEEPEPEQEIEN